MITAFLAAESSGGGRPAWLEVVLVTVPALTALGVAIVGAPWLKEKLSGAKREPISNPTVIPPAVAVQPSDPLITMMIQGLQKDLARARSKEERLTNQRFVDVETIARLSAELDDAEFRASQYAEELRLSQRLESDQKQELIELRVQVTNLTNRLNECLLEGKR